METKDPTPAWTFKTREQLVLFTCVMMLAFFGISFLSSRLQGNDPSAALVGAAAGAVIGSVNSLIVYAISRRVVIAAWVVGIGATMSGHHVPFAIYIKYFLVITPAMAILAFFIPRPHLKPAGPISSDPLYDADTDRAANRESARVDSAGGSG